MIRVEKADLEAWHSAAGLAEISLSEWIRRKCRAEGLVAEGTLNEVRRVTRGHIKNQALKLCKNPGHLHDYASGDECSETKGRTGPPRDKGAIAASVPYDGGVCENGHELEPGVPGRCTKWGCKFYAFAR